MFLDRPKVFVIETLSLTGVIDIDIPVNDSSFWYDRPRKLTDSIIGKSLEHDFPLLIRDLRPQTRIFEYKCIFFSAMCREKDEKDL